MGASSSQVQPTGASKQTPGSARPPCGPQCPVRILGSHPLRSMSSYTAARTSRPDGIADWAEWLQASSTVRPDMGQGGMCASSRVRRWTLFDRGTRCQATSSAAPTITPATGLLTDIRGRSRSSRRHRACPFQAMIKLWLWRNEVFCVREILTMSGWVIYCGGPTRHAAARRKRPKRKRKRIAGEMCGSEGRKCLQNESPGPGR